MSTQTQIDPSTALHLGTVLMVTTALSSISLVNAGISPILLILAIFAVACFALTRHCSLKARCALAVSGSTAALLCHFSITWLLTLAQ